MSSIQIGSSRANFFPGIVLGLGVVGHFDSKNQTRKIIYIIYYISYIYLLFFFVLFRNFSNKNAQC